MENLNDLNEKPNLQKQHVTELEISEARLHMAMASTNLGTWDYYPQTGKLDLNTESKKIYGLYTDESVDLNKFLSHVHPADKATIQQNIEHALNNITNNTFDITHRIVRFNDKSIGWVRTQGTVYFDEYQKAKRLVGIILDLTEAKLAEEKSAKLAAIVESSDDAIISKTLDGIITSWNYAAEQLFGYTENEVIGKPITILIPEDRLEEEKLILDRIRQSKKVDNYVTFRVTKSGLEIPVSLTISPIKNSSGKVIGASKIARNNARQKMAEAQLLRYAENLELLNAVGKVISERLDVEDILQKVTDATTQLTGAAFGAFFYNKLDDRGESYMLFALSGAPREAFEKFGMPRNTAVFHPTFIGESIVRSDDITKDPRYGKSAPHFGMPKGHLPVVSYLAVPVISKSGSVIGGLFYGHPDAGKFTREHEQLVSGVATQATVALDNAKLYEEIQKLNDKKDEFIGLASHELKTPVTSLSGYLQILNRTLSEADRNKPFVQKALLQVNKLSELISDLLDVSKIETGHLPLSFTKFDLVQLVLDVIELTQYTTKTHRIVMCPEVESIMVFADKQRIEQVIINLLSNAIKYSPNKMLVNVIVGINNDRARVAVQDFGMGIHQDQQERVFSRFYRVEELAAHISGLGIGLYISKEIINRHNGKLWLESEVDTGSIFSFEIPVKQ
jgi:PAS domain S-box-containing protein